RGTALHQRLALHVAFGEARQEFQLVTTPVAEHGFAACRLGCRAVALAVPGDLDAAEGMAASQPSGGLQKTVRPPTLDCVLQDRPERSGESKESDLAARGGDDGCRGRGGLALGRGRLAGCPRPKRRSGSGRRPTPAAPPPPPAGGGAPSSPLPSPVR